MNWAGRGGGDAARHRTSPSSQAAGSRGPLVEVLPAEEYKEDHLPGAVNVPLRHIDVEGVGGLDKDRPVIVYCWDTA